MAVVTSGTLIAVSHARPTPDPLLEVPLYQDCLFFCIAGVSLAIAYWLRDEWRRSAHLSICALLVGFFGQALLFAGATVVRLRTPPALLWFNVLEAFWVVLFGLLAALLLASQPVRRWVRQISGEGRYLAALLLICFAVYAIAGIRAARAFPDNAPMPAAFAIELGLGTSVILTGMIFFLRRRRPAVLPLIAGMLVFLMSQSALAMSAPWHLLWWVGHLLYFSGLLLIGRGVLEGHRVFEREDLISRLALLTAKLEEQSVRDPLTGSYNRRHAMNQLEGEFKKAQRGRLPLTLLIGDIDDFKKINDSYGHLCGDQVLREASVRLATSVRESDVVARCGGEEFWILLPLTNRIGGKEVANKTLATLRARPFIYEADSMQLTMSIGIADTLSPGVTDVATLIREADRALYAAKNAGKDRAMILDPLAFTVPAGE